MEFLVVLVLALGLGLAANALNENGLSLTRNYFDVSLKDPVPKLPAVEIELTGDSVLEKVSARLRQVGLRPITHDEAVTVFRDELTEIEQYIFVDARNDQHYQSGHIPNAFQFDHFQMQRFVDVVLRACKFADKIVVYCYGMDCTDSEITATHIINSGVPRENVLIYVGGIETWCGAGLKVETGERGSGQLVECEP